jgi:hypothetical protein
MDNKPTGASLPLQKATRKPLYWTFGIIASAVVALIIISKATTIDANDLARYGREGQVEKLFTYINENLRDSRKRQLVEAAIVAICETKTKSNLDSLEQFYYATKENLILQTLNRDKTTLPSFDRFWSTNKTAILENGTSPELSDMWGNYPLSLTLPRLVEALENAVRERQDALVLDLTKALRAMISKKELKSDELQRALDALASGANSISQMQAGISQDEAILSRFAGGDYLIQTFAIKRRFGSEGSNGVYEVLNTSTFERAALVADPEDIPSSPMERFSLRLVVRKVGEYPFELTDSYGDRVRTEYFSKYETSHELRGVPTISEHLPQRRVSLQSLQDQFRNDSPSLVEQIRKEANSILGVSQPPNAADKTSSSASQSLKGYLLQINSDDPGPSTNIPEEVRKVFNDDDGSHLQSVSVDLNGDGIKELLVMGQGGSGSDPWVIFDVTNKRVIGKIGALVIFVKDRKQGGYFVLEGYNSLGWQFGSVTQYAFDGRSYRDDSKFELEGDQKTKYLNDRENLPHPK